MKFIQTKGSLVENGDNKTGKQRTYGINFLVQRRSNQWQAPHTRKLTSSDRKKTSLLTELSIICSTLIEVQIQHFKENNPDFNSASETFYSDKNN